MALRKGHERPDGTILLWFRLVRVGDMTRIRTQWTERAPRGRILTAILVSSLLVASAYADAVLVKLQAATVQAWDRYYQWADQRVQRQLADPARFLIQDRLSDKERKEVRAKLEKGEIVQQRVTTDVIPPGEKFTVPHGEIHHAWGSVLIPRIKLPDLLKFLQDYDHHAGKFADVERSRLISRQGDRFMIYYRLSRTKAFVSATYNTEQEAVYTTISPKQVFSKSIASRIAELENPGTPKEKERPAGEDHGFLWRLVSWWRFEETDNGVIVECESASLSRDVPAILAWMPLIGRYIRSTPLESLRSVLTSIQSQFPAKK